MTNLILNFYLSVNCRSECHILCNDDRKAKFFKTPLKENQNIKDFILEIPYYNREDENDAKYCIELYLIPNKEEAQQISEWKENKDKFKDIYPNSRKTSSFRSGI